MKGSGIDVEQGDEERSPTPEGIATYNPAFDVTPAHLIAGIITEKGVITPVTAGSIRATLGLDD